MLLATYRQADEPASATSFYLLRLLDSTFTAAVLSDWAGLDRAIADTLVAAPTDPWIGPG